MTADQPVSPPRQARLRHVLDRVRSARPVENSGHVTQVIGLVIESEGPLAALGDLCRIRSGNGCEDCYAEVVGFRQQRLLLMPLSEVHGIQPGSEVVAMNRALQANVSDGLLGRTVNGIGEPIDELGPIECARPVPVHVPPPHPLRRARIGEVFQTGIKAVDTFIPCGRGQRLGIFAGSGVGKSTLLGMMASRAEADVNVIALIGERGREVREFLEDALDEEGRRKSVIVVATSNEPALARLKGAFLATAIAEHFRDEGKNVLLMMDSVTRFAMAQREIGLAVGEPPATRGYTPSVFSLLPQLLERAGSNERGTITGLYTVLVEADDMNDPIADSVRSILDGHIVLSRDLATRNHYPAIDVLESVSRLTRDLLDEEQQGTMSKAREHLALYRKNEDLINIGAYPKGSNPAIDAAITLREPLARFLMQHPTEGFASPQSWDELRKALTQTAAPTPRAEPPRTQQNDL